MTANRKTLILWAVTLVVAGVFGYAIGAARQFWKGIERLDSKSGTYVTLHVQALRALRNDDPQTAIELIENRLDADVVSLLLTGDALRDQESGRWEDLAEDTQLALLRAKAYRHEFAPPTEQVRLIRFLQNLPSTDRLLETDAATTPAEGDPAPIEEAETPASESPEPEPAPTEPPPAEVQPAPAEAPAAEAQPAPAEPPPAEAQPAPAEAPAAEAQPAAAEQPPQ
jgi:hypothetical protein